MDKDTVKSIVKLAVDTYKGNVKNYSVDESSEVLRKAFSDLLDFTDEKGRIDRKVFRRHKGEIFEIIEEIVNETLEEGLRNQFDKFADYRNLSWGDENLFTVPANNIFHVAMISDGNSNLRRQRLRDGEEFSVGLDTYGIKVGEEFYRFLAGRINWVDFINGISKSFEVDLTQRVYDAVMSSYGSYGSEYHNTFTSAPTEDDIVEMAMHIEARTGESVSIYGTKLALRQLSPSVTSDKVNEDRNKLGYYGEIAGIKSYEIKQSHKYGTDEFAIDNNFVLLLPETTDKMIKIVNEGDSIIYEARDSENADMMQEYFISNKFGIAVVTSKVFGFAKW